MSSGPKNFCSSFKHNDSNNKDMIAYVNVMRLIFMGHYNLYEGNN